MSFIYTPIPSGGVFHRPSLPINRRKSAGVKLKNLGSAVTSRPANPARTVPGFERFVSGIECDNTILAGEVPTRWNVENARLRVSPIGRPPFDGIGGQGRCDRKQGKQAAERGPGEDARHKPSSFVVCVGKFESAHERNPPRYSPSGAPVPRGGAGFRPEAGALRANRACCTSSKVRTP